MTVTVKNADTGAARSAVTNEAGVYTTSLLPIGGYEVVFELQGFQTVTMKNVTLHVNDRLQLDCEADASAASPRVWTSPPRDRSCSRLRRYSRR